MAASASGGRDWYAALPLPWRTDSLGYVLRSIGAAALALGLGLYLQLDSPFSAASTVLLLINPVQGAVVGKGWWRAVGTLVGTLAAFVLTALFAQKMLLFVVALGFWLGLCVGVMSLVRHFYASAIFFIKAPENGAFLWVAAFLPMFVPTPERLPLAWF